MPCQALNIVRKLSRAPAMSPSRALSTAICGIATFSNIRLPELRAIAVTRSNAAIAARVSTREGVPHPEKSCQDRNRDTCSLHLSHDIVRCRPRFPPPSANRHEIRDVVQTHAVVLIRFLRGAGLYQRLWFLQLDSLPTDSGSTLLPRSGSVVVHGVDPDFLIAPSPALTAR